VLVGVLVGGTRVGVLVGVFVGGTRVGVLVGGTRVGVSVLVAVGVGVAINSHPILIRASATWS
jgi:hypothetical protein